MGNILPSPSLDLPIEIDNNINLTEIERRRLEDEDGAVRHNLSYSTTITNSNANNTNHISTNDNVVGPVRLLDSPSFSQGRRQQHGAGIMRQNSNTRTSTSTSSRRRNTDRNSEANIMNNDSNQNESHAVFSTQENILQFETMVYVYPSSMYIRKGFGGTYRIGFSYDLDTNFAIASVYTNLSEKQTFPLKILDLVETKRPRKEESNKSKENKKMLKESIQKEYYNEKNYIHDLEFPPINKNDEYFPGIKENPHVGKNYVQKEDVLIYDNLSLDNQKVRFPSTFSDKSSILSQNKPFLLTQKIIRKGENLEVELPPFSKPSFAREIPYGKTQEKEGHVPKEDFKSLEELEEFYRELDSQRSNQKINKTRSEDTTKVEKILRVPFTLVITPLLELPQTQNENISSTKDLLPKKKTKGKEESDSYSRQSRHHSKLERFIT